MILCGGAQSSLRPDTVRDNRCDYEAARSSGPHLSAAGSLANIIWLVALPAKVLTIGYRFLRLELIIMPAALVLSSVVIILLQGPC